MPVNDALSLKKAAKAAYDREYRRKNAEKIKVSKKIYGQSDTKKAADKKWASENRLRSRAIKSAWKKRNPSADADYYATHAVAIRAREAARSAANPEIARANTKAWRLANPHHASALAGKRAASVRRATPKWADLEKMRSIYLEARARKMEVDHVVPLQGKTVSGLHVEHNLRIVSRQENRQKGARHAS